MKEKTYVYPKYATGDFTIFGLTGLHIFLGIGAPTMIFAIIFGFSGLFSSIPIAILIKVLFAKNNENRYSTVQELLIQIAFLFSKKNYRKRGRR